MSDPPVARTQDSNTSKIRGEPLEPPGRPAIWMKIFNIKLANKETHFKAFHGSALCGYPRYPTALNSTSKRVRVNARVNNCPVGARCHHRHCVGPTMHICKIRTDAPNITEHWNISGATGSDQPQQSWLFTSQNLRIYSFSADFRRYHSSRWSARVALFRAWHYAAGQHHHRRIYLAPYLTGAQKYYYHSKNLKSRLKHLTVDQTWPHVRRTLQQLSAPKWQLVDTIVEPVPVLTLKNKCSVLSQWDGCPGPISPSTDKKHGGTTWTAHRNLWRNGILRITWCLSTPDGSSSCLSVVRCW